ncbi:MAG: response regulator [Candidatus Paceibacterota bacterium]|jgi:CheY-like chemotaxis protein
MDQAPGLNRDNISENKEKLKKRILVADDDETTLALFNEVVSEFGYDVVVVKNGKELLDKLNSGEKFDAILSDNNMPKMDGIDVLEQIRKNPEFKTMPFILLTGMSSPELEARVKELGGIFLKKPPKFEDLENLLKEVLKETT